MSAEAVRVPCGQSADPACADLAASRERFAGADLAASRERFAGSDSSVSRERFASSDYSASCEPHSGSDSSASCEFSDPHASPAASGTLTDVEVVFFDVGSTLMYACPSVPEMFTAVAHERGHEVELSAVAPHMAAVDAFYEEEYLRDGDFWCDHDRAVSIWHDMYRMLARLAGLEEDDRGLAEAVYQRYRQGDSWACYEDVTPCLRALKMRGMRLGVISNWDAELESLLRKVGLLPYFDVVVSSAAVGCRKPDPAIFEIALERMGVGARRAVHVGDLPEADGAASRVGMTPLIIDRKGAHANCGFTRVARLTDIPALL